MMQENKCGTCKFAQPLPNDLKQKICFGGPPQLIVLPNRNGGLDVQSGRPHVGVMDVACSFYQPKFELQQ